MPSTVRHGDLFAGATWGTGSVPSAWDTCVIRHNVRVNLVSDSPLRVIVNPGGQLTFSTTRASRLTARLLKIEPGGRWEMNTQQRAEIIFPDVPLDPLMDPKEEENGLICLGDCLIAGNARTRWVRLATGLAAGDAVITFLEPVFGWATGDRVVIGDTQPQALPAIRPGVLPSRSETATVASVAADGLSARLSRGLLHDHPCGLNWNGEEEFMPVAGNLTSNITIKSFNFYSVRGYTLFSGNGSVDIRNAVFHGLGRYLCPYLTDHPHVDGEEEEEIARCAVSLCNLIGPPGLPEGTPQYTLDGCVVEDVGDSQYMWGIAVQRSHYGSVSGNVVYNWAGSGIVLWSGTETGNTISRNHVVKIRGDGDRDHWGHNGDGIASRSGRQNIDANVICDVDGAGPYSYGISIYQAGASVSSALGTVRVPSMPGIEPDLDGDIHALPLLSCAGNEIIACKNGITVWNVGYRPWEPRGPAGSIDGLLCWNVRQWGAFLYPTNNLTLNRWRMFSGGGDRAIWCGDYVQVGLRIVDCEVAGWWIGIDAPGNCPRWSDLKVVEKECTIDRPKLRNANNVWVSPPWSVFGGGTVGQKRLTVNSPVFEAPAGEPLIGVHMHRDGPGAGEYDRANHVAPDEVIVNDWRGFSWKVMYAEQRADWSPVPTQSADDKRIGVPQPGLTNQQAWEQFAMAVAGAVAPDGAASSDWAVGLLENLS